MYKGPVRPVTIETQIDAKTHIRTEREKLKKTRKEAYLKAKDKRDHDPRYIALKETQKNRRKKLSQDMQKNRAEEKGVRTAEERKERDRKVLKMIGKASDVLPKN